MNTVELDNIAKEIHDTKKDKNMTPRELVNAFGFEKRTSGNCSVINHWLEENNLTTNPDYETHFIDAYVSLHYRYKIKSNNFQLYYLEIKGYKNLLNFSVDLYSTDNYCCFIGLNGSGKSNVLEAISHIFYSLYHIATLKDGLKRYPCKFEYTIRYILNGNLYEISDGELKNGAKITLDILPKNIIASYSGEDTRLWKECYKQLYGKYCSRMVATQGFKPPFMFYISRYEWEISLLTLLYSEDIDVVKFINDLIGNSTCKISFEYNSTNIRKWEGTDIEAFVEKLREKQEYDIESFRETINNISFIDQPSTLFYCLYKCRTEGENHEHQIINKINIEFDKKGSVNGLSEGEKKLINANVIIHILSTKDTLCLFDEPDAHIHIGKQKELKKLIDTENRYSLVTTHSPVFLDMLCNDTNIRYMDNGSAQNTDKLKEISSLSAGAIDYLEGSFIMSSKKILVTEGPYDKIYLEKAIAVLKQNNKQYEKFNRIAIIPSGSADNTKTFYEQMLKSQIDNYDKIVFLFDYDVAGYNGWKYIRDLNIAKLYSVFYQDNYDSEKDQKPEEDTFMVEDLFPTESYQSITKKVLDCKTHKDFRNIKGKSTADAIKKHIEDNHKTFKDAWFDGFKPVLDKLLEVFDLE